MEYTELLQQLFEAGFTRVERDDRLLDIFPHEDREKGIELWERWPPSRASLATGGDIDVVKILRVRLPFTDAALQLFALQRSELESLLLTNRQATLSDYAPLAKGPAAVTALRSMR